MSLLELRSIVKEFPGVRALGGVSFELEKGEIHALCGENGAGKSTLIKIVCGFYPAGSYQGQIHYKGKTIELRGIRSAEEAGIALIPQELALVPDLSVEENLLLGREPVTGGLIRWDVVRAEAKRALERVGLEVDPARPVRELGIGQQQMVEIAKALLKNAEVLVLDEPTAALGESDARRLLSFLKELRARGVGMIYISHRLEEVFQIADRITVLRDGVSVSTDPTATLTEASVISRMVGREVKNLYPRPPTATAAPSLRVTGWSVADAANPGRFVLKDVSFDVRPGEVLGIGGLMGAGRTALVSSLFGAGRSKVEGTISLEGRPGGSSLPFRSPAEAIAARMVLVSEDRKRHGLVLEASIAENLTLATLRRFARAGFLDHAARTRESRAQSDALRIKAPGLHSIVGTLSGGNQQKVVLGKWLMASPRVLILDEPTRGIDVGAKSEIYQLVHELAAKGLAILLVSSDLPELLGMSHRILVLNQGRQAALLEGEQATPESVMAAATRKVTGGLAA